MADQPHWSLSDDRRTAIIDLPTTPPARFMLDADELDSMIANLGAMRADMQPPVPMADDPDPGTRIETALRGRWYIEPVPAQKQIALALLHPGFRWVALMFDYREAKALASKILQNLPDQFGER